MTISTAPGSAPGVETAAATTAARAPAREPELLDHEYDGIREYDNPMPGWWVATFWATFLFGIGYLFHYYVSQHGVSVADAYEQDMAEARAEQAKRSLGEAVTEEGLQKLALDPALMKDAQAIFGQRCLPCHGEHGQGVIGPNLTDAYWLHGGTLMDIHRTVSEGVPAKGMPPWKMQLTPVQVRELAAFIGGTLRGKNLPGKQPEGEPFAPASP
jgi:cytochrome c oxidase cbb3-type subunit 3